MWANKSTPKFFINKKTCCPFQSYVETVLAQFRSLVDTLLGNREVGAYSFDSLSTPLFRFFEFFDTLFEIFWNSWRANS